MKKILALLLALCMIFALAACGSSESSAPAEKPAEEPAEEGAEAPEDVLPEVDENELPEDVPEPASEESAAPAGEGISADELIVGMVCVEDENSGYDYAHIEGVETAMETLGIPAENLILKVDIGETDECADAIEDCIQQGADIVFTDSYGHQDFAYQMAEKYPDVIIVSMTGDYAWTTGLDNYKNAFPHTFESRYVSGVVAGLKLQEMIDNGEVPENGTDEDGNYKLGYVGAYPYAEVVSGYTAYYLGVKSVVENVVMDVRFTNSWYDPIAEASAAEAMMADGCFIISQHADSTGAPSAVQAARDAGSNVYCVGYNISMLNVAPTAALTSASNNWSVYYTEALRCMLEGEDVPTDWSEGYATGAVYITELGESCAEGTAEKVDEVEAAIADGSLQVFDCSTFTVGGEEVESFLALDTDGDWEGDTGEAIKDGVFYESDLRAAPYFSLAIDGITQLIEG